VGRGIKKEGVTRSQAWEKRKGASRTNWFNLSERGGVSLLFPYSRNRVGGRKRKAKENGPFWTARKKKRESPIPPPVQRKGIGVSDDRVGLMWKRGRRRRRHRKETEKKIILIALRSEGGGGRVFLAGHEVLSWNQNRQGDLKGGCVQSDGLR